MVTIRVALNEFLKFISAELAKVLQGISGDVVKGIREIELYVLNVQLK